MGAFAPALNGVYSRSEVSAGKTLLDGVVAVIDGLQPGISVDFGYTLTSGQLVLSGHQVSLTTQWGTLTGTSRWNLPNLELVAGVAYALSLDGSTVRVSRIG